eukprot:gene63310-86606_t
MAAGATAVVVALAQTDVFTTVLVFAALTLISTLAVRRYLPRAAAMDQDINDNVSRIVGHRGSSVSPFAGGAGRVSIDGKEWAAQLVDGDALEAGAPVEVTGVDVLVHRCRGRRRWTRTSTTTSAGLWVTADRRTL